MADNDILNPQQKQNLIGSELQKAKQVNAGVPSSIGILNIKSANQTLRDASMTEIQSSSMASSGLNMR